MGPHNPRHQRTSAWAEGRTTRGRQAGRTATRGSPPLVAETHRKEGRADKVCPRRRAATAQPRGRHPLRGGGGGEGERRSEALPQHLPRARARRGGKGQHGAAGSRRRKRRPGKAQRKTPTGPDADSPHSLCGDAAAAAVAAAAAEGGRQRRRWRQSRSGRHGPLVGPPGATTPLASLPARAVVMCTGHRTASTPPQHPNTHARDEPRQAPRAGAWEGAGEDAPANRPGGAAETGGLGVNQSWLAAARLPRGTG